MYIFLLILERTFEAIDKDVQVSLSIENTKHVYGIVITLMNSISKHQEDHLDSEYHTLTYICARVEIFPDDVKKQFFYILNKRFGMIRLILYKWYFSLLKENVPDKFAINQLIYILYTSFLKEYTKEVMNHDTLDFLKPYIDSSRPSRLAFDVDLQISVINFSRYIFLSKISESVYETAVLLQSC